MQIEHLSDHARDQLRSTEAQRVKAQWKAQSYDDEVAEANANYDKARRERSWWKRLIGSTSTEMDDATKQKLDAQRLAAEVRDQMYRLDDRTGWQRAGVAGEQNFTSLLESALSDEWSGFAGYRNKRGEADLVLVGPSAVWVVEVKNRNARVVAEGDRWTFQKFDKYDNLVENGRATDATGRNWGQQASHVAESLNSWLGRNEVEVPMRTAVVLVHAQASIERSVNPGVDLLTADPHDLVRALQSSDRSIAVDVAERVAQLIRRDHRFNAR